MREGVGKALLALIVFFAACLPPKSVDLPPPDAYGCQPPPPDVFTKADVDLDVAKSTFRDLVVGAVDVKAKPEVVSLASKAVTDRRIRDHLRCLAIKESGYSLEQAAYLDVFADFMSTEPNPDQVLEWQRTNPFPGKLPKRGTLRLLIGTKEPMPGATITISGPSGLLGQGIADVEGEARIEIPADFKGTEIDVAIELENFMTQSRRVVAKDGAIVVFDMSQSHKPR